MTLKNFSLSAITLLLLNVNPITVSALPGTSSSEHIQVFVRTADFAYHPSEDMARKVRARHVELPLQKRSYAEVEACYTTSCTNCHLIYNGTFTTNSACISATNTACLIVSNLKDANVWYWNHEGCNGKNNHLANCPPDSNLVGAPGTNSIGVHTGCK